MSHFLQCSNYARNHRRAAHGSKRPLLILIVDYHAKRSDNHQTKPRQLPFLLKCIIHQHFECATVDFTVAVAWFNQLNPVKIHRSHVTQSTAALSAPQAGRYLGSGSFPPGLPPSHCRLNMNCKK